jgi:photosystem II stability/assembly factor-like uncharacterized protein
MALTVALLGSSVIAAGLMAQPGPRARGAAPDTGLSVTWRNIGPNQAGRMTAVAGSTARPDEYYMGTTGGGVWKTTDGGKTAVPVTDAYFGGTIGSIAVQQSNPDVVWVGGGETPIRGNVSHGDGVWKSTDAGKTWQYMGLKETQYIARVRIHPDNPDIVYVGALGHVFGPNKERGVYRTTDGGKSWKQILFRNDSTGVADLILDPSNPKVIYATFWQAGRKPWQLVSGGMGSGIFKSTDGGDTWTEITRNPGLPQAGPLGAIGITVSPAKPSRLWAIVEHEPNGGVYRSDDAGATWQFMTGDRNLRQRSWYYSKLYADPKDTNVVYGPQVSPLVSKDGGKTFVRGFGGGDNHDIWIDPTDPKRIAVAHDNGMIVTKDGGTTSTRVAAPTGQYYHVHLTNHFPYHVCGAKQDAGSSCGPVRAEAPGGRAAMMAMMGGGGGAPAAPASPFSTFYGVAGGESGYVSSDPRDPDITYGANYGGSMDMLNRRTGKSLALDPWPLNPMGHDALDSKYRFQWTYPIVHSPHDPNTIYVGSNVVFRSTNRGMSWTPISRDLTRNDPRTLGPSGGPITKDQTSVEYYGTVFTLAESPKVKGVIWTGSDDGLIHLSRDNGVTWKNVTPKGLPEWMRWSIIEASPHAPGTAWVAGNRYQMDDFTPYLYRTTDYGVTWTKITAGIPADQFTRAIREDLHRPGMLYAATERGVWLSYDAGASWESLQRNLPPVPVHDMMLRDDDLAIATHGRAFWVLENLTPLRWGKEAAAASAAPFLYRPVPVYRLNGQASPTFTYRLPADSQVVTFELFDATGARVARVSSSDSTPAPSAGRGGFGGGMPAAKPGTRKGVNRFTMPMRHENAVTFRGMITWAGSGAGPAMAPGRYKVVMTVGSAAPVAKEFALLPDPRSEATAADLQEQVRFALQVRNRITQANQGVIEVRNLTRDLEDRKAKMAAVPAFAPAAAQLAARLKVSEDSLYQTKNQSGQDPLNFPIRLNDQLGGLMGFILSGERRPPRQAYDVYTVLGGKLDGEIATLERTIATELPKINAMLKAAGVAEIVRSKVEPQAPRSGIVP